MFIQYEDSRREIKVNFEMLSICPCNKNGALKKSDGESLLKHEME